MSGRTVRALLCLFALACWGCGGQGLSPEYKVTIDFSRNPSSAEVVTYLKQIEKMYPEYVTAYEIGRSSQNRPIMAVRITKKSSGLPEKKPSMFLAAQHHGDENASLQVALYFITYVLMNAEKNPLVSHLLTTRTLYVVPSVNVDGNDAGERLNSNPNLPVDLARNYSFGWQLGFDEKRRDEYGGTEPFSEPETKAIRDFIRAHDKLNVAVILQSAGQKNPAAPDRNKLFYPDFSVQDGFPQDVEKYKFITGETAFLATKGELAAPTITPSAIIKGGESAATPMAWLHANSIYAWNPDVTPAVKEDTITLCKRWTTPLLYYWAALPNIGLYSATVKNGSLFITVGNDGILPIDVMVQVFKGDRKLYYIPEKNLADTPKEILIPLAPEELKGVFFITINGNMTSGAQTEIYKVVLELLRDEWITTLAERNYEPPINLRQMFR